MEQRVQKFIAQSGYSSRRKAEQLIEEKRVKVNGEIITLGAHCTENDTITIDNKPLSIKPVESIYLIMNKPKGLVTTNNDEFNRKTIFDILPEQYQNTKLFSVGRLDKDTTGLLIITNDGQITQQIIHPSSKIAKTYHLTLDKKLKESDKKALEKGIILDEQKLSPCVIKNHKTYYLIKIWEGRKRQIRRMFEEKNYEIKSLERTKIGELELNKLNLKKGQIKKVSREFLEKTIPLNK